MPSTHILIDLKLYKVYNDAKSNTVPAFYINKCQRTTLQNIKAVVVLKSSFQMLSATVRKWQNLLFDRHISTASKMKLSEKLSMMSYLLRVCLACFMTVHVVFLCSIYLGSLGIFGSVIVPSHAEHILRAVVELREAVELTIVVVNGRLVDATEGGLGVIGAVEERLDNQPTLVKVSCTSQMEPLRRWTNLILQVCG